MKCDLHVHSIHSGPCTTPILGWICRECYSDPAELYSTLKGRGMSLVTITDHDSIEAAEVLRHHTDFFLSEEVTCAMPSGTEIHVGVYDITERQHVEIQRRRGDLIALIMYLTERRIFFVLNHVFSSVTGRRELEDFRWFNDFFPAFETRNGLMLPQCNQQAASLAARLGKVAVGGSDAHTLASAGTAYTTMPGARDKADFLAGLRAGEGVASGDLGSFLRRYYKLTCDVLHITGAMMREKPGTALLAPLAMLIPAVTLGTCMSDAAFARRWNARIEGHAPPYERAPLWGAAEIALEVPAWP